MISARRVSEILCVVVVLYVVLVTFSPVRTLNRANSSCVPYGWSYVGESILHAESDAKDVQVCCAAARGCEDCTCHVRAKLCSHTDGVLTA